MVAEVSAAPAPAVVKKSAKSKKAPSAHPPYGDMIKRALKELKERGGSSRQAIAKFIKAHYKVDDRLESHLRRALVAGVKAGKLVHTKGIGASGSFKLSEKATTPKKAAPRPKSAKKTPKKKSAAKKPKAAPKPKAPGAPKAAKAAKPAKPKAVKPKKAKTPKKPKTLKPKKPVAKKTPKKIAKK